MVDYKDTLNLPRTGFEMRGNLAQKEPRLLEEWGREDLYGKLQTARADHPRFVMHDGPPYANGHLHHGHILNKILKDIVVKDRSMRGCSTGFIPGWDCHGLPIEVQVDKELGKRKAEMSKIEIRQACRAYAERFVGIQRDEFRRLGVLARWDEPYLTMRFAYEATIVRELAGFATAGLLYKGLRPVNWCSVHQTALAEAEVEYEDHKSPSIYVAFPLQGELPGLAGVEADLVVWTTTPWTLPANRATALHPGYEYVAYPVKGRVRVVAQKRLADFLREVGEAEPEDSKILKSWRGAELEGLSYRHPVFERDCPVVMANHVTLEAGTGCVHTAPGHGPDDFMVGRRYGLEIASPVDDRGRFTAEAGPFAGQGVFAANKEIISFLQERGLLLNEDTITHRYAHCWRCHRPIILRATEQWFVAIDKPFADGPSLRERALAALKEVRWIPPWGEDRIRGMLEARPDWCLSRQRTWGVPITVVYCEGCCEPVVDAERMEKVASLFEEEGADAWFQRSVEELMGPMVCPGCGGKSFRKEEDILDVWFESGVSYAAVIEKGGWGQPEGRPVDLYLEGSDQHRGWFHSALLCGLATRGHAPYRTVLTHGFVVDGQGKKVSKSKGNFVDPFKTINQNGAEMLRLWVAAEDYREDIRISPEIMRRLSDTYRKIRNTVRYVLGNLDDFDPNQHLVAAEDLLPLDRTMLCSVRRNMEQMLEAYEQYEFHLVLVRLVDLCIVELSAFYLDVLKDRLYVSPPAGLARRSAQTALFLMGRDLLRVMAPVLSFTAEEAWQHLPRLDEDPSSVHLALYPGHDEPPAIRAMWEGVQAGVEQWEPAYRRAREVRRGVNRILEEARKEKQIGSSSEAQVVVSGPPGDLELLRQLGEQELADLFIVSRVILREADQWSLEVSKAPGTKCARCWLYKEDVGADSQQPTICGRCVEAL